MRRHIGKMRHRIQLFEPARQPDGSGGFSRGDVNYATVWAEMKPLKEVEVLQYAKLEQVRSHKCAIRYREDVKQGHYLVHDGQYFYIEAVQVVLENRKFLDLSLRNGGPV